MFKKLLIITLASQIAHAQQLSPVQLQKVKTNFDTALKAKKFDDAQAYLKQIEQGGRKAYSQELAAELAKARQQETQAKSLTELHTAHQAHAEEVIKLRKQEYRNTDQLLQKEKYEMAQKEAALKKELQEAQQKQAKLEKQLKEAQEKQAKQAQEFEKYRQK